MIRIFLKACLEAYKSYTAMEKAFQLFADFPVNDPSTMFETMTEYNGFLVEV